MVRTVVMLGMLRQIPPHTHCGVFRKGAAKRGIDALHRANGVADERLIVHIAEEALRRRMPAAKVDGMLKYLGPVTRGGKANGAGIDLIAEGAVQDGAQARERRYGNEGIAVGLNNPGVGIRLQESVQAGEVGRRLEYPLHPWTAPLQMLQEATMKLIRRSEVSVVDPGLVRRDLEGGG